MMKMSANNMNEPIVRWRERGVAFLCYHITLSHAVISHFLC